MYKNANKFSKPIWQISQVGKRFRLLLSNDSFLNFLNFFVILLSPRYADTQIRRYADRCSRLLAIDASLFTKIDFLLTA